MQPVLSRVDVRGVPLPIQPGLIRGPRAKGAGNNRDSQPKPHGHGEAEADSLSLPAPAWGCFSRRRGVVTCRRSDQAMVGSLDARFLLEDRFVRDWRGVVFGNQNRKDRRGRLEPKLPSFRAVARSADCVLEDS